MTFRNKFNETHTIKIGDSIGWKQGLEQAGIVIEINDYTAVIKNDGHFSGKIEQEETVIVYLEDCWKI